MVLKLPIELVLIVKRIDLPEILSTIPVLMSDPTSTEVDRAKGNEFVRLQEKRSLLVDMALVLTIEQLLGPRASIMLGLLIAIPIALAGIGMVPGRSVIMVMVTSVTKVITT